MTESNKAHDNINAHNEEEVHRAEQASEERTFSNDDDTPKRGDFKPRTTMEKVGFYGGLFVAGAAVTGVSIAGYYYVCGRLAARGVDISE